MAFKNSAGIKFNKDTELIIRADQDGTVESCFNLANNTEYAAGASPLSWLGAGLELVKDYEPVTYKFSETAFDTWTPSTTAANMVNAVTKDTILADAAYDYIAIFDFVADVKYTVSQAAAQLVRASDCITRASFGVPSTVADLESESVATLTTANRTYRNNVYASSATATTLSIASTSDMIYPDTAFTSTSGMNITLSEPAIKMKCNNTYFSTAQAANVDKENSTITYKLTLYRVKRGTNMESAISIRANDLYNGVL